MTRTDNIIKLLLIEDSLEEAEQIISILRNGGIAVRPARAGNEAELEAALEQQTPDVIIANLDTADLTMAQVAAAASRGGKDIALIATGRGITEDRIVAAFHDGARGLALRDRPDHVQMIVNREFEALTMRRSVRRIEAALRESERRCEALLDSSRDPIAYVHEGMHVRANKAYLEMFGFDDFEDVEGMSILDMIAADDADDFKALLKRLSKGEKPPQRLNLKAQRGDGSTFDATMEFTEASYEGEPCQQITFRRQMVDANLAQELDALRSKDLVTELFNRQHTIAQIENAASAAASGAVDQALLLIEPDNFKQVLDGVGLGNADVLLGDMANLVRRHIGESEVPGRMGEHTFGVLVTKRNVEDTRQLAEKLRKAFEERIFEIGKQSISLTVSIGGALIGEKNANAQTVLAQAQTALRTAQAEGGNRVNIFDPAALDKAAAEKTKHWIALDRRSAGQRRIRPLLPADRQPARRRRRVLRSLAAHEGRQGRDPARPLPADRRAERQAAGDRSLGHRERDPLDRRARARRTQDDVLHQADATIARRSDPAPVDRAAAQERAPARRFAGVRDAGKQGRNQLETRARVREGARADPLRLRARTIRLGPQLIPAAQAHPCALPQDRPQLHGRTAQAQGKPGKDQGNLRSGASCRQAHSRRVRRGRGEHVDPVLMRREFRAGQFPAGA